MYILYLFYFCFILFKRFYEVLKKKKTYILLKNFHTIAIPVTMMEADAV